MFHGKTTSRRQGFTLVELLVIAPVALLVITGFVALMVTMVGDIIASRTYNTMTYDVQDAISTIQRDVQLSSEFQTTSGSLYSPQGKDNATAAFTSTAGDLVLGMIATDKNPLDPTRRFVYYDEPFECSSEKEVFRNRIFFVTVAYFVEDNSLWRRTYVPEKPWGKRFCSEPWQVNSCAPDYPSSAGRCQTTDVEVLKNVKDFSITYYSEPHDSVALPATSASAATTIQIELESERTAAGRTVSASSNGHATKLSSHEINLSPPNAPVVTSSVSGTTAHFSWPGVPTATSYIIKYNINGGDWVTASENSVQTSFSVPAAHGDTVSINVLARNTTGASSDSTSNNATATIPLWNNCELENNWRNYVDIHGGGYGTCGYTLTKDGVVVLKGLLAQGTISSNITLFQLPPGYRPSHTLIFRAVMAGNQITRVNVGTDGRVTLLTSGTSAQSFLSLDNIRFIPTASSQHRWTNMTLQNSWTHWGGSHPPLQSLMDSSGRVHLQGVIREGTFTAGTVISTLPSGFATTPSHITPVYTANGSDFVYLNSAGQITPRGASTGSFLSIQSIYYPASYSEWNTFSQVSGAPGSGQIGNGWIRWSTGFPPAEYTKGPDNIVTLRGLMRDGSNTNGTVMAVLPPGYRPGNRTMVSTYSNGNTNLTRLDILPDGRIIIIFNNPTSWTSLDNITFVAEN